MRFLTHLRCEKSHESFSSKTSIEYSIFFPCLQGFISKKLPDGKVQRLFRQAGLRSMRQGDAVPMPRARYAVWKTTVFAASAKYGS